MIPVIVGIVKPTSSLERFYPSAGVILKAFRLSKGFYIPIKLKKREEGMTTQSVIADTHSSL